MEDNCSSLTWAHFYQEEGLEEFKQYLVYTTELETTVVATREEIIRKELDIINLKDLLARAIKERNEAQTQCQKLMLDKFLLQQLLQVQQQQEHQNQLQQQETQLLKQESGPFSGTSSSEDESKASEPSNQETSPDSSKFIVASHSQGRDQIPQRYLHTSQAQDSPAPDVVSQLAADKTLPEKGKLLQAVKDAGPLLKTLLLAGPLPQWQHPPPQVDCIEIPPVTISSPTTQLIHQDSFASSSPCLSKKRALEPCEATDPAPSPTSKYQTLVIH